MKRKTAQPVSGPVAQLAEHDTFNVGVVGSSPTRPTMQKPANRAVCPVCARPLARGSVRLSVRGRWIADLPAAYGRPRRRVSCASEGEAVALLTASRRLLSGVPMPPACPTVHEAVLALLDSARARCRARGTVKGLQTRLAVIERAVGPSRRLADVNPDVVAALVRSMRPRNGLNYYRIARQLVRYGVRRGWMEADPLRGLDPPAWRPAVPAILTPEQVDALLTHAPARLTPYLAIGTLAGLRPGELEALDWSAVDLDASTILVLPETSKVRRARYVPICQRLRDILCQFDIPDGRVCPGVKALRRLRAAACKAAGVVWSQDVMRHTYATARLATETAGMVALDMGTSEAMLTRHYRGLARRADYAGYFSAPPASTDPAKARGR
jgi:integrase